MTNVPDSELLAGFVLNHSEAAFDALVERYIALVHSVALRHTASPQHAEDITQAVFIILARKAGSLGRKVVLSGWLYHTARLAAANYLRTETRRIRREQEAFMQSTIEESSPDTVWRELSPQLDAAMAGLGAVERDALVLRYFQNKSMAEVGAELGLGENTAQKRVSRALEKLRKFFTKRGVAFSAAAIAAAVSANSVKAAPAVLSKTISAVAMTKGMAAGGATLPLVKGVLIFMAWTKVKTTVVVGVGLLLAGAATTSVVIQLNHAADRGRLSSFHMQGRIRSSANDNFSAIAAQADFIPIELWEQFKPKLEWRVEKALGDKNGRVAVMDGQSTTAWFKPNNMAMKFPGAAPSAFDTDWIHRIASLQKSITNEIKAARAKGWRVDETPEVAAGGRKASVVTIETKSGLPDSSEQKNWFLMTADTREVYHFDDETKRLVAVQIYLEEKSGETLVFESTQIDYNLAIQPDRFHLDLPADVAWYQEPQKVAGPDKYAKLTPDQAARAFFEACSREDWEEVAKFWSMPINDQLKQYLGGLKIVRLGDAYASKPYPGRFVPYEIQLRPQEFNVCVSKTNAAGRYVITGTYDSALQPQDELKWLDLPAQLADSDPDLKLSPAGVVKTYFQAVSNLDLVEMRKFTPESDVESTRRQIEAAKKSGEPMPGFEVDDAVWSADHSAFFVKCRMSRSVTKSKMSIRNDNAAGHWIVDGGI